MLRTDDPSAWTVTRLASVGRHVSGHGSIADDRRFFNAIDVAKSRDSTGPFDAIIIGSGDREDPNGKDVDNYFYMIKDRATASGQPPAATLEHADFADLTDNCLQDSSCASPPDLTHGWRLGLEEPGEKVLATPLTITGKVFFTSYMPRSGASATACSPSEGAGRLYAVSLADATAVINYDTSDDDPGNPDEPNSKADRSVELRSLGIPAEVVSVPPNKILRPDLQIDNVDVTTRWRTFWYLSEDEDL